jgi:hypothetical protein
VDELCGSEAGKTCTARPFFGSKHYFIHASAAARMMLASPVRERGVANRASVAGDGAGWLRETVARLDIVIHTPGPWLRHVRETRCSLGQGKNVGGAQKLRHIFT